MRMCILPQYLCCKVAVQVRKTQGNICLLSNSSSNFPNKQANKMLEIASKLIQRNRSLYNLKNFSETSY